MRLPLLSFPLLFLVLLLFLSTRSSAQNISMEEGSIDQSSKAKEFEREALQRLRKLPPEKVEELDAKLAEALMLLYDREYERALPIFREISGTVETMEIMFWTASAAAGAGELDVAIETFKRMLEIDPHHHQARLELASVYFGTGRYEEARFELRTVLEAQPPDAVRKKAQRMLAAIDERTRRLFTALGGSLGFQRDSNVSAGPDKGIIISEGGLTIGPLRETEKSLSDWVTVGTAFGTMTYDHGGKGAWMWNTAGSFYQSHNLKYHQFDYTQFRASTGPWWVGRTSVLKLPIGYSYNMYEHEDLYHSYDFTPNYEYFFTPAFSLRGTFSYARETYTYSVVANDDLSGQDGLLRIWELNPNFYFNNRKDVLSFYISDENVNTKSMLYTYDAVNLGVSYLKLFTVLDGDMEFYGRYRYTRREYEVPFFGWTSPRTDDRHNLYVVLSRSLTKSLFASLSYNLFLNESNTDLYEFDKNVLSFMIGFKL